MNNDKTINNLLSKSKLNDIIKTLEVELTNKLRIAYKGKMVKCECFDYFIGGENYHFKEELIDIIAHRNHRDDFHINVTFMYKSSFSNLSSVKSPATFHLQNIELL